MNAASLHGDFQCLTSTAPPSVFDKLVSTHSASSSIRRKSRRFTSTLVCSNRANFFLACYRRPRFVRATPNGDAAEESNDSDADPPRGVNSGEELEGGAAAREVPQVFASFKDALVSGTHRYMHEFKEELKTEAGLDLENVARAYYACLAHIERRLTPLLQTSKIKARELAVWGRESSDIFKQRIWPQFVAWNRIDLWKDVKGWDTQRYGAMALYLLVAAVCVRALHSIFIQPLVIKQITNSYMEATIPEPSPQNIRKLRTAMWRNRLPKGLRMQRYIKGPDDELHRDLSYVGDNPWDEREYEKLPSNMDELIDKNTNLTPEQKKEIKEEIAEFNDLERKEEEARAKMSWKERLEEWDRLLQIEDMKDRVLAENSKFVIGVDFDEVKKSVKKKEDVQMQTKPPRGFLLSKKWWQYKPKLPYTYFLNKLRRFEVESAVYTSDLRRLYVRMKEGFPAEYTVDIPVDPFLHDLMKSCEVEIDVIGRNEWSYYLRAFIVIAPSVYILLQVKHFSHRAMEMTSEKILDLLKMDQEHLILPEDAAQKAQSEYKDVIIGDKIWKVLEEIMGYMRDPMRYYDKGLHIPRGVLISGPPGTGKTLLARAIARESGLPFVFASGAEFVESSKVKGAEKVFNIFFTARANAPSFIFIDEIDALAGKNVEDDPERRATFDRLITELDGLPENTSVDRFSKRQAVVLICATNRPHELHQTLLRPGRIDREIHIGLPGEQQRIRIFAVHSRNRRLAEDVDFSKVVFRTAGFSGADIRNLINEAGILAARRQRKEICQQDFADVLDKQLFEGMGLSLTDEEQISMQKNVPIETRRLLAVHEAGHVLLAHLFPRFDRLALTHLLPGGKQHALSLFYPREEMLSKTYTTVGYLKMHIVVAHGGRCAERLVFGDDLTDGGQDDLARISRIAREIAISHASPRLGLYPMLWKDKFDPPLPPDEVDLIPRNWHKPGNRIANMTMELSEMFTREVTRYADEGEDEAMRGLSMNRHILERLAEELVERINMSGSEIEELIHSMNPVMLPDYLDPSVYKMDPSEVPADYRKAWRYEELNIWQAPLPSC